MIIIGNRKLTVGDFFKVLFEGEKVDIDIESRQKVAEDFEFLKEFAKGKVIYGINTGLGPMAQFKINNNRELELQYNLIRSHAAGCGSPLPEIYAKATMLAIEMISILQAIDFLEIKDRLSSYSLSKYQDLRQIVPKFTEDTIKYKDIQNIEQYIMENKPQFSVEE